MRPVADDATHLGPPPARRRSVGVSAGEVVVAVLEVRDAELQELAGPHIPIDPARIAYAHHPVAVDRDTVAIQRAVKSRRAFAAAAHCCRRHRRHQLEQHLGTCQ